MTIYDLIGRIKNNTAPKKIEIYGETFKYDDESMDYIDSDGAKLFEDYCWLQGLDDMLDDYADYIINDFTNFTFTGKINNEPDTVDDILTDLIDIINRIDKLESESREKTNSIDKLEEAIFWLTYSDEATKK